MTSARYEFVVHGQPVAQGRPRFARQTNGGVRTYSPERSVSWRDTAIGVFVNHWDRGSSSTELVTVDVRAVMQRPKKLTSKRYSSARIPNPCRPDADNIGKAVLDALTAAGVLRDDAQVYDLHVTKHYTALDEGPRVEVDLYVAGAVA